jgi:hypothetical protein
MAATAAFGRARDLGACGLRNSLRFTRLCYAETVLANVRYGWKADRTVMSAEGWFRSGRFWVSNRSIGRNLLGTSRRRESCNSDSEDRSKTKSGSHKFDEIGTVRRCKARIVQGVQEQQYAHNQRNNKGQRRLLVLGHFPLLLFEAKHLSTDSEGINSGVPASGDLIGNGNIQPTTSAPAGSQMVSSGRPLWVESRPP